MTDQWDADGWPLHYGVYSRNASGALMEFAKVKGIPGYMTITQGLEWYIEQVTGDPEMSKRIMSRLLTREVPGTPRGIEEQIQQAIEEQQFDDLERRYQYDIQRQQEEQENE